MTDKIKVSDLLFDRPLEPVPWRWPEDTWLQKRLRELKEEAND